MINNKKKHLREYSLSIESISYLRSTGDLEKELMRSGFDLKKPIEQRNNFDKGRVTYYQEYDVEDEEIKRDKEWDDKVLELGYKEAMLQHAKELLAKDKQKPNPNYVDNNDDADDILYPPPEQEQEQKQSPVKEEPKPPVNNLLLFKDIKI